MLLPAIGLFAQEEDTTECPYFNVSSTDTSGVVFSLTSTDIVATISGVIANVVVEQTYLNAGDSTIDATYVFPMSTNAAIYGMEMQVNDRTIVAEIRRRAEAQEIFEEADSAGITASLLEQERPNVFQMSLANINPGDTLRVRMVYTELLVPTDGIYQFVFPNIVAPRFTTNGEPWVYQTSLDSIPLSETPLNINLKINAGMPLLAECVSHDTPFDYTDNTATTTLATNPGDDFIVDYTLDGNQIETGLLLYEGEEENFFLSIIQPPKPDVVYESPKREYIFIMDVSGSMSGTPIETSKQLIINLLNDLNSQDKFNIIFFAGGSATLANQSLPVNSQNIDLAIDMIENIDAGGGTQLLPALEQALDMGGTEDYSRTFAILTDGGVTVEKEAFDLIRQNLNEANFFAFGIGTSVNRYIIEGIAYVGEGEPFVVTDLSNAYTMADKFKTYIERPALTNIEATFDGMDVYDVEPYTVPDVFAERPVIIYGKYSGPAQGTVNLLGDYGSEVVSSTLEVADYTADMEENDALRYLWARKRLRLMSDYGIASNENDTISIEEEITQLGLQYSLITEFTAFVAVDSNAVAAGDNEQGGDGPIVDDTSIETPSSSKRDFLSVWGMVRGQEGIVRLEVKELAALTDHQSLTLRITSINGQVLAEHPLRLANNQGTELVTLSVGQLPEGTYLISLSSASQVLETEKFVVVN